MSLKRYVLYGIAAFAAGVGVAMLGYVVRYWALSRNQSAGHRSIRSRICGFRWSRSRALCAGLILPVVGGLDLLGGQQRASRRRPCRKKR